MVRTLTPLLVAALAALVAGCGGNGDDNPPPTVAQTTTVVEPPPLARIARKDGELIFSGASAPTSYGVFKLDGRYLVRFEQYSPKNPKLDFSRRPPFTARLRRVGAKGAGVELFDAASARGKRELRKQGEYVLDVSTGDFPFAVRFTPRRSPRGRLKDQSS